MEKRSRFKKFGYPFLNNKVVKKYPKNEPKLIK